MSFVKWILQRGKLLQLWDSNVHEVTGALTATVLVGQRLSI
jgi:hypothetical protein